MANLEARYRDPTAQNPSKATTSGGSGVCMMSTTWRDEQHPSFINFISSFLSANSFRLNFVPIAPDFIFNCGGLSVAFIFVTNLDCKCISPMFSRVQKLKGQFAHLYVVVVLPTKEQNELFVHSYFKYGMELGKPTFVPVEDLEMGFEKIVKIAISRGVCKRQDVITKLKAERKQSVQAMDVFLQVLTSIPGIENHDANALNQAIGSIEAIAKASKEYILQNTDLSADKAEIISRFFRDPNFYMSPKINRSEKQGHVNSMLKLADFIHDRLVRYTDIETRFSCYPGFQFKTVSDGLAADHPRSLDKFMELYDSLNSKTKPLLREMLVSNQLGSNTRPSLTCIIVEDSLAFLPAILPMTLIYYFHFSLNKQINYQIFPQAMGESATSHY